MTQTRINYAEERLLGRDFEQADTTVATVGATLGMPSSPNTKPIQINFRDARGASVLNYRGDATYTQNRLISDTSAYLKNVEGEMRKLALSGRSSADYWSSPSRFSSTGAYSFTYRTGDGRTVTTNYNYKYTDAAQALSVRMEAAAEGEYVKLANPYNGSLYVRAADYRPGVHGAQSGTDRYDLVTKYNGVSLNTQNPTELNDALRPYAENAINEMVTGFSLTLNATDYTYLSMQADELPNTAVRTTFESEVLRTVRPSWGVSIQCSGDTPDHMFISRFSMDVYELGIHTANAKTEESATEMINLVGEAQKYVSSKRSLYGAYQNRLEHTYAIRSQMEEDTTSAESKIRDTDMAKEMVSYSRHRILNDFGQSLLAQANHGTEGVLALLA